MGRKDAEEYTKRAKLLVEQYNKMEPLPGLHVNGELTLGENIGDLTGATIAHRAYLMSLNGTPAPTLDGLSADERFYMAWGAEWRAKFRDDALRQQVLTNPHAPDMYRANGPLRNIPEFYDTFGVNEGDKMFLAPAERAKIWCARALGSGSRDQGSACRRGAGLNGSVIGAVGGASIAAKSARPGTCVPPTG